MTTEKVLDGLLVLQYKSGDKKALEVLVKKYHTKFCNHSYWYTKDIDAAKDVAQESWKSILRNIESLKDCNSFGSWAMRIVTRKSIDYVKKRQKELYRNNEYYSENRNGIEANTKNEYLEKLKLGIEKLPENQQVVLRLFYTQEYSLQDISSILEISEGTVKSRLFHAREKLKKIIKK